jgi:uracil-DNA glycosylase family 4
LSKQAVCPCERILVAKHPKLLYDGPLQPRILVIGTSPSIQDDNTGRLFSGEDGQKLTKLFKKLGVDIAQIGWTNVVSCFCDKKPSNEYIKCCNQNLLKTIITHKKKLELVILLGSLATKTILQKSDMSKLVGQIHKIGTVWHLPMLEPSKKQSEGKVKQAERDLQKAIALINLDIDTVIHWEMIGAKRLQELKPEILSAKVLTVDCETSSLDMNDATQFLIGVGMCFDTKGRKGCFIPLEHPDLHISCQEYNARVELIREIMLSGIGIRGFNGGFDLSWLHTNLDIDIDKVNYISDPMHEHHFIKGRHESSKLENLTLDYIPELAGYDAAVDVLKVEYGKKFAHFPLDKIAPYCVGDTIATAILAEEVFDSKIKKIGSQNLYQNILIPTVPIYAKISMNGIKLDTEYCKQITKVYAKKVPELYEECVNTKLIKKYDSGIDIGSPTKVAEFLYSKLGLPKQYNKQKSLSSDKKAIEALLELKSLEDDVREFLVLFQGYREVDTINTRYASKWQTWIGWDGLVHPNFDVSGTISGRLSTSSPNFQQLSNTETDDKTAVQRFLKKWPVRKMVISRFPDGRLVSCDFSQLELRLIGMVSNDAIIVGTYRDGLHGGDLHKALAVSLNPNFYNETEDVQKKLRRLAKPKNFKGGYSLNEEFLSAYPGLHKYVDKIRSQAIVRGYVDTVFNRRRVIPDLRLPVPDIETYLMTKEEKSNFFRRLSAIRQAVNHTIQSPAHEIMEIALKQINRRMLEEKLKSLLILEIHDDFLSDCIPEEIEIMGKIMQEEMEGVAKKLDWTNGVPLVAEPEICENWSNKKPLIFST